MKYFKMVGPALMITVVMLVICGFVYPAFVTGISRVLFPAQAAGSLMYAGGKNVGSEIIGQDFTKPYFFKCRPSAVKYNNYSAEQKEDGTFAGLASGSYNYAPSNPALAERIKKDRDDFLAANPDIKVQDIPSDLLAASGSGLDPHISVHAALIQIPAVSKASGLAESELKAIVEQHTEGKFIGIFGEKRVNVLKVNAEIALKLDL